MWHRPALALFVCSFFAPQFWPGLLLAQKPADDKKVIVLPLDPLAEAKNAGDLLTWIHTGSVKFGGTDPIYQIRVLKNGTAIVPKDHRQRESKLKLTDQQIESLQKSLLGETAMQQIAGPWFGGQANLWDGSQDCYLIRDDQKVVTLTCEYGWPSESAHHDLMIQRYHRVMQTYTDLIQRVRAGGLAAIARQVPLANQGLKKHLPGADPLTIEDFAYGEDFNDGQRRLTFVREKEMPDGQWEKVRFEVLVPDDGEPRLGDVTINGHRFPSLPEQISTKPTK